jgi:hypothetical protein
MSSSSLLSTNIKSPMPVAARFKAYVCGCSVAGIAGSNPAEGMDVYLLCVCCVGRGLSDGPIVGIAVSNPAEGMDVYLLCVCVV